MINRLISFDTKRRNMNLRISPIILVVLSLCTASNNAFHMPRNSLRQYSSSSSLIVNAKRQKEEIKERQGILDGFFNNDSIETQQPEPLQREQSGSSPLTQIFRGGAGVEDAIVDGESDNKVVLLVGAAIATLGISSVALSNSNIDLPTIQESITYVQTFFNDPQTAMKSVAESVEEMGPAGALYFGIVYTIAEILALPAIPLTASAGYLFGIVQGTGVVLVSASIAAAVSFIIGRTVLRSFVEEKLKDYPKFAKIDRAIGNQGFRCMLLLRLSPVFPFALSNYFYGASSIEFWPYFFGTMLGFAPGTIAYVSFGEVGKAVILGDGAEGVQPWYVYAIGLTVLGAVLKFAADTASNIIEDVENQE